MRALRIVGLALVGGGILAIELALRGDPDLHRQVIGQCAAFALFVLAVALAWRGLGAGWLGLALILVLAVGFRAAAFDPADRTPPLSTDIHRYAWDGRVQAAGSSPYRYAPADPALEGLRDNVVWPAINLPTWRTVYPPGAEASFVAARATFGDRLRSTTWLYLIAEAAAVALLLLALARSGAALERITVYAWHPLAISEIAANGHVDALAVVGLAGLLAAWTLGRRALAGAAVAVAALVKLGPALLLPALARSGGRRFVVAGAALIALAYVPYLVAGTNAVGSLYRYLDDQAFNGSLTRVLTPILGPAVTTIVLGLALAAVVLAVATRDHVSASDVARSSLLVLGTLLLCLDYVQPWHALWLLPFMTLTLAPGWLWLSGALPLAYLNGLDGSLPDWVGPVVYGPLVAWAGVRVWRARRPRAESLSPLPSRPRVAAIIPALDEEPALRGVLAEIPAGVVDEVIVVDGGSRDRTAIVAAAAGARVLIEPRQGYGRACAAGAAAADADVLVFLDGDGSDDPEGLQAVLEPVLAGRAALSLGARVRCEPGALTPQQRVGNRVVATLVRAMHGLRVRDVPSMRAVRRDALERLRMREMTFGWPTEMVVKAARAGLPVAEAEVTYRARRAGASKVAGRLGPSARAGAHMLAVTLRHA